MSSSLCALEIQSGFDTTIHVLISLCVAASYIPQLIQIATNDQTGNAAISGWYIVLLTTSASAHLAARVNNHISSKAWRCIRGRELEGFNAFSAALVFVQPFIHWASAIILLAFYASYRTKVTPRGKSGDEDTSHTPSPSNPVLLAVVLTHAAILLPLACYSLQQYSTHGNENIFVASMNAINAATVLVTGMLTSLTAAIPQIRLMVVQSREDSRAQGSLSTLGLGLQVIAFTALAVSQGWRMRLPPPPPADIFPWSQPAVGSRGWWGHFLFERGLAAGWLALAVSQLLVMCVALGLGKGGGEGVGYLNL
ncbi:hypothetical protein BDW59DRAFT_155059 [Aspergillus cavernicola]|uniref:Uncharacterized protein n=1 Tax=Aspergillus cavernicola TaxID=176166 RepID=A0ABR4HBS3_9EURO